MSPARTRSGIKSSRPARPGCARTGTPRARRITATASAGVRRLRGTLAGPPARGPRDPYPFLFIERAKTLNEFKNPEQEPGAEKRLLLTFALVMVVLFGSQWLMQRFGPK